MPKSSARRAPQKSQPRMSPTRTWFVVVGSLTLLYGFIVLIAVMSIMGSFHDLQATKLDLYQKSYSAVVVDYYANAMNSIEAIAGTTSVAKDLQTNNTSDLANNLMYERIYNDQFDSLLLLNKAGSLVALSSNAPLVLPNVSLDNGHISPTVRTAVLTYKPQITNAFVTLAHRQAIAFTSPIYDSHKNYVGSVIGISTLKQLPNRAPFLSRFQNLQSVVIDSGGTVVVMNAQQVSRLQNVTGKEPILAALKTTDSAQQSEINYAGQRVVAEATKLHIGNIASTTVISYEPQHDYDGIGQGPTIKIVALLIMQVITNVLLVIVVTGRRNWLRRRR